MTDKILQTTANIIVANAVTYGPKTASISTPVLVTGNGTYSNTTTNVDYLNLKVQVTNMGEEVLPNGGLFERAQDFPILVERFSVGFTTPKTELLAASDVFSKTTSFARVFPESQTTSDSYKVFAVGKGIEDPVALTETVQKSFSTIFSDQFVKSDQISIEPGKVFSENVSIVQEVVTLQPNKGAAETINTQDILSRVVTFNADLADLVDATDDFLGLANTDDDQTASVGKTLADSSTASEVNTLATTIAKLETVAGTDLFSRQVDFSRALLDTGITAEILYLDTAKILVDSTITSDLITTQNTFNRTVTDTAINSEIISLGSSKVVDDSTTNSEQVFSTSGKNLLEVSATQDLISTQWSVSRSLLDSANTQFQISFSATTELFDSATKSDLVTLQAIKAFDDVSVTADVLSRTVNYNQEFTDLVDATDDFLGVANTDDDQTASVGKTLADSTTNSDQIATQTTKIFADTATTSDVLSSGGSSDRTASDIGAVSETISLAPQKSLADSVTNSEQLTTQSTKAVIETATTSDVLSSQTGFFRTLLDTSTASEAVSLGSQKILADSTTNSDLVTTQSTFNRTIIDTSTTSDVLSRQADFARTLLDILTSSDSLRFESSAVLSDSISKQDQIQNAPGKVIADFALSTDNITLNFTFGRFFTDTSATNDSGFINNQSYFEGSYVEPGYVGTNTNFS